VPQQFCAGALVVAWPYGRVLHEIASFSREIASFSLGRSCNLQQQGQLSQGGLMRMSMGFGRKCNSSERFGHKFYRFRNCQTKKLYTVPAAID